MRAPRLGRGRGKAVKKFGITNGLWVVAIVVAALIVIVLLFRVGFFRTDVD